MSKHLHIPDIFLGMLTSITVASWLFQVFSVFVLAMVGALSGWIFGEYVKPLLKPKFDKIFKKKEEKA